jgi:acyl-CoA synthetase (AMP-forming)/AMP-acid ligase II
VLPETIEAVLSAHPQVRACLAFGVPSVDNQRGETIVACVVGKDAVPGESLKQFALAHLAAWQVPREWWFVETLEVNGRGKLSRAEWRKRYFESGRVSSTVKVK